MDPEHFQRIWRQPRDLRAMKTAQCEFATAFQDWMNARLEPLLATPTLMALRQEQLIITMRYMEWRSCVGEPHRSMVGSPGHGACIYEVWIAGWERLRAVELALAPVLWLGPAQPPAPPPVQIGGIFLGEED